MPEQVLCEIYDRRDLCQMPAAYRVGGGSGIGTYISVCQEHVDDYGILWVGYGHTIVPLTEDNAVDPDSVNDIRTDFVVDT